MSKIIETEDFLTENISNAKTTTTSRRDAGRFLAQHIAKQVAIAVVTTVAVHYTFKKLEEKYPLTDADLFTE